MSFITDLLTGNIKVSGSIFPTNNTISLGSSVQSWSNIYVASGNISVVQPVISNISNLILDQVLTYSTTPTDALIIGQYGITDGISAPYTVIQFTTVPNPALQVGDLMTGTGIPPDSYVLFTGTGIYENIVIISQTVANNVPSYGTILSFTRATVSAAMGLFTPENTDIQLTTGIGGQIVMHGNVSPYIDNFYNVGSRLRRFNDVFLGGNIYMTDQTLGYTNILNSNDGYFNILGSTGFSVGQFIFNGSNLFIQDSAVDINIGSIQDTGNVVISRPLEVVNNGGIVSFNVARDGRTKIFAPNIIPITDSAFQIIGTPGGVSQPRNFTGTMIQVTGQPDIPTRITFDSFGYQNSQNAYTVLASRAARGTVNSPLPLQSGDIIMRLSNQAWTSAGSYASGIARLSFEARDYMTATAQGTLARFQMVPQGANVIQDVVTFATDHVSLYNNTGLKFTDGTVQNTAWLGITPASNITGLSSVATSGSYNDLSNTPTISAVGHSGNFGDLQAVPPLVYSVTVGAGLTQTGTTGNISINATGVQSITASPGYGQLSVTDTGGKNLILALPQALATNSQVTFGNLTIAGNLVVNGTFTATYNSSVENKILNLANNATSGSQIDGGGIVLGQDGFSVSLLYNLADNSWNTDGAGLNSLYLNTSNATINFLNVSTQQHIGLAYVGYDYPNAPLQIDGNFNGYSQVVSVNHSAGTSASTDFIATSNLGDDETYYIDMGINSSNFSDVNWTINGPNDGYLYVDAGNLAIGTDTPGTKLVFFTGGTLLENMTGYITSGGRWIIGATDDTVTKLQVGGDASITGNIAAATITVANSTTSGTALVGSIVPGPFVNANLQVFGDQNQTLQVLAQNTNGGSASSTDFVATANNGTDTVNYIDMGINSNTYSQAGYTAQYPNDGYLFTSSSNLVISTQTAGKKIVFTTDGINANNLAGFVSGQRWILGGTDDGKTKLQVGNDISASGNITAGKTLTAGSIVTTAIGTTGDLTVVGTARVNNLVANATVQALGSLFANTLSSNSTSISQTLNVTGAAQVNSLTTNLLTTSQTLTVAGQAIVNSLQSNLAITTNGLQSSAQATVANLVSNGAIQGTSANLVSVTASTYGNFAQNVYIGSGNTSTSTTTGALIVTGGAGIGGNVYVGGNINVSGNLISNGQVITGITGPTGAASNVTGPTGPQGSDGSAGPTGPTGPTGFSGTSGYSGYSGATGGQGTAGTSGYSGYSGFSGISGYSGYSGATGGQGTTGTSGDSGYSGFSGISGYSGYSGATGSQGEQGNTGTSGYSGYSGAIGPSGYSGFSGISGYSGYSGATGGQGNTGISGYSGYSGFSGISGYSGYSGATGGQGNTGISGYSGYSGYSGFSGISGYSGYSGATGSQGGQGNSGTSGYSGYSGFSGISGYSGATGGVISYGNTNVASYLSGPVTIGNLFVSNTTISTNVNSGALIVAGGAGIAGNVNIGNLTIGAGTNTMAPINIATGVLKTNATAGSLEFDGEIFYLTPSDAQRGLIPAAQYYQLGQTRTLPLVAQPVNNSLFGPNVAVTGGTKYQYEIVAMIAKTSTASTPSLQYAMGGSSTLTEHDYLAMVSIGSANTTVQSASSMMSNLTASFSTMVAISNTAPTGSSLYRVRIDGILGVNSTGNVQPMISLSTGTPTAFSVAAGSWMRIWPTATTTAGNIAIGNWS
jgi:hypothetical protein